MSMRDDAVPKPFTFQEGLEELADRIAEADGIPPLQPGEIRPPGFYLVNHYFDWGGKPLPPRKPRDKG
jgi:hypothetical protein